MAFYLPQHLGAMATPNVSGQVVWKSRPGDKETAKSPDRAKDRE